VAIVVRFKRLPAGAGLPLPSKKTPGSAGFDLSSAVEVEIPPSHRSGPVRVATGFAISLPEGVEGQVRARSGLALKGIIVANAPGTIDSDYRGPLDVILANVGPEPYLVKRGDRIAQLVIATVAVDVEVVEEAFDPSTARGEGGFGSTGR
jgi:dUTP pyrophosphatase